MTALRASASVKAPARARCRRRRPRSRDRARARRSSSARDPSGGEHGQPAGKHLGEELEIGACQRAVAARAGDEQPADAGRGAAVGELARAQRRTSASSPRRRRGRPAHRRRRRAARRSVRPPRTGTWGRAPRCRPSPGRPRPRARPRSLQRPVAAADLDRHVRGDRGDPRRADRVTGARRTLRRGRRDGAAARRRAQSAAASSAGSPPSIAIRSRTPS